MFCYLKQKQFQICLLQETHLSRTIRNIWHNQLGHNIYFSHGTTASRGICDIINKNFKCKTTKVISDTEGRWLICNLKTEEHNFPLSMCMLQIWMIPPFFKQLFTQIENKGLENIIMGGF